MKTKIVIAGLGGVGGYYGGLLAKHYTDDPEIEICFLARGEHLKKVQENGLKLINETGTLVVKPALATDDVNEIGTADYVIMATKSYDLESMVEQIKPCVGNTTVILPLLNGIDNSERIRAMLPDTEVWDGCVYIVTRLTSPGVVESTGKVHRLNFGWENRTTERLRSFEKILKNTGIDATFNEDIITKIWQKFFFISSSATLTSYFNVGFRDLVTDEQRKDTLIRILEELLLVANAEGADIDRSEIEKIVHQLEKLPEDSTSSMHSDFKAGKTTELETLTGIVVKLARKHGIDAPGYAKIYSALSKRMKL